MKHRVGVDSIHAKSSISEHEFWRRAFCLRRSTGLCPADRKVRLTCLCQESEQFRTEALQFEIKLPYARQRLRQALNDRVFLRAFHEGIWLRRDIAALEIEYGWGHERGRVSSTGSATTACRAVAGDQLTGLSAG
jgi:hypothetical protein